MKRIASLALAAAMAVAPAAAGAQVWGTDTGIQLSGNRSIAGGGFVAGSPGYTSLNVAWTIVAEGSLLRYTYTFSGLSPANMISHGIIELSAGCSFANGCISDVTGGQGEIGTYALAPSNPGFPAGEDIYGIKINTSGDPSGTLTYSFLSNRLPVWGDMYLKGASDLYSYNTGLTDHTSNNINWFVARPDTQPMSTVPEPSTYALLGSGLLAIAGIARRRRTA